MCSADTSGENVDGSGSESGVPADGVETGTLADTDTGGKAQAREPHDLTPYLALVISTYGATKSVLATAVVAAIIAVIAVVVNHR